MIDVNYERLRSIGVSVESADAIAPIIDILTPDKREAFYLWILGVDIRVICKQTGLSTGAFYRAIEKVRDYYGTIRDYPTF